MAATIHPSQRRLSCELCRKYKSSCRRQHPNDPKCTRCTMLGVECTSGQQKKVGRPRRVAAPGKEAAKDPKNMYPSAPDSQDAWMEEMMLLSQPAATALAPEDGFSTIQVDSLNRLLQLPDNDVPSWNAPNDPVETCSSSSAFSASTPPGYLFDTPLTRTTMSSPADSVYPRADAPTEFATNSVAASEALAKLSKINLDLHARMAATEANKDTLDFHSLVYRESPLFIDNLTLAEFVLGSFQEFMMILTQLRDSRPRPPRASYRTPQPTSSASPQLCLVPSQMDHGQGGQYSHNYNHSSTLPTYPFAASEPLLAPLALTITSIFVQLMSLCELTVKHVTVDIERHAVETIKPFPGLMFGGFALGGPCTQGMLYFNIVVHLLERIERILGIGMVPEGGEAGLLSARQMDVLWGELDGRGSGAHGRGAMRPMYVREAFDKIGQRLKQLALG
jgi:hypothetical protein